MITGIGTDAGMPEACCRNIDKVIMVAEWV